LYESASDIKNMHHSIVVVLAVPAAGLDAAEIVERVVSSTPRESARTLLLVLRGEPVPAEALHMDADRQRNLRNRLALIQRDLGPCELVVAVHYGPKATKPPERVLPTADMMQLVIDRIEDEGLDGVRWRVAQTLDELPEAPHQRCELALVGIDGKGRVESALPRPNHYDLDRHFGRNLPALVQAVLDHPMMADTDRFCRHNGLTRVFLWRPVNR
jgi:hypothetical protein